MNRGRFISMGAWAGVAIGALPLSFAGCHEPAPTSRAAARPAATTPSTPASAPREPTSSAPTTESESGSPALRPVASASGESATPPRPADTDAPAASATSWPGITVDRERKQIDLAARVVLREGDWLELIACVPGTREHEAILAVDAKPTHIHLALLSLGLMPGSPIQSRIENDQVVVIPPQGPTIDVFFVVVREGQPTELPVQAWVRDQANGQPMPPTRFLFTGSAFVEHEGQTLYMADLEGSIVSLVNFGDDLITRDSTQTNQTDNAQWGAHTEAIPPLGTRVTLRLRAAD